MTTHIARNSHVPGRLRDDQGSLIDLCNQTDKIGRDLIDGTVNLADEIAGTRQITSQFSDHLVQIAHNLEKISLGLRALSRYHAQRTDSANQLAEHHSMLVDDLGEGLRVAKVTDRVALNVDDVLELRLSEVDQPINSPLDLDRHFSVRVHHILLTLHGPLTRYVAGAVLTPFQWLHRKAGIRQVSVPRGLSDATPTGGGQ